MRKRQQDRAVEDVKAELLLDRIATAEKIEADRRRRGKRDRRAGGTQWRIGNSGSR